MGPQMVAGVPQAGFATRCLAGGLDPVENAPRAAGGRREITRLVRVGALEGAPRFVPAGQSTGVEPFEQARQRAGVFAMDGHADGLLLGEPFWHGGRGTARAFAALSAAAVAFGRAPG